MDRKPDYRGFAVFITLATLLFNFKYGDIPYLWAFTLTFCILVVGWCGMKEKENTLDKRQDPG